MLYVIKLSIQQEQVRTSLFVTLIFMFPCWKSNGGGGGGGAEVAACLEKQPTK